MEVDITWGGTCKILNRKTFKSKETGDYFILISINLSLGGESQGGLRFTLKQG